MGNPYKNSFYTNVNLDICAMGIVYKNDPNCKRLFKGVLTKGFILTVNKFFEEFRYLGYMKYNLKKKYDFINSKQFGEISKNLK